MFPNRDRECFGCSLANYFEYINDYDMAHRVYANFRKHPLVTKSGLIINMVSPSLVQDLTEGYYRAFLQYQSMPEEEMVRILFDDLWRYS